MKWTAGVAIVIIYIFLYLAISLCWIGAEWLFEGAVHSSHVDGVVAAVLAYSATRGIYRLNKAEERLPRCDGWYLAYILGWITLAWWNNGMWEEFATCKAESKQVTHWMPLPEPPKMDKEEPANEG